MNKLQVFICINLQIIQLILYLWWDSSEYYWDLRSKWLCFIREVGFYFGGVVLRI